MAKKNFVSYGDAETLMSEIADKFDSLPAPTPAPDLSAYETSWTGTKDEWEALDDEEKAKYQIVNITDDNSISNVPQKLEVTVNSTFNPVVKVYRTGNVVSVHMEAGSFSGGTNVMATGFPKPIGNIDAYGSAVQNNGLTYQGFFRVTNTGAMHLYGTDASPSLPIRAYLTYITSE